MYLTKIIDKNGLLEDVVKDIDKECNEMQEKGYELVTYYFHQYAEKIIMTFKKSK